MICPNCKSTLVEGKLYCENCGEEIKIVPDFEPEIESELHDTLKGMADELKYGIKNMEQEQIELEISRFMEDDKIVSKYLLKFIRKKIVYIIIFLLLFIIVLGGIWFYSLQLHKNSYEYQYGQALVSETNGNYSDAILYMENAIAIEPDNHSGKLQLAKYYIKVSRSEKAIVLLKELIEYSDVETDAYILLLDLYGKQEEYDTISHLLLNCKNQKILDKYQEYIAYVPEYNFAEGTYQEVIALKLSANTKGTIYYSIDGSKPTKNSNVYETPLFLENGVYRISSFFVNEYGIESEVITKIYTIDTTVPYAPQVRLYSGTYSRPQLISVDIPDNCDIYYTIDGTTPTVESLHYTTPIPMYLGEVNIKFVAINFQGVSSEVTDRTYNLVMNGLVSTADAVNTLVMRLTALEYLLDYNGYVAGKEGRNAYLISSGITVSDFDYYLIVEYYEAVDGSMTKTGNIFAVDINTGEIYNFRTNISGNYYITPL